MSEKESKKKVTKKKTRRVRKKKVVEVIDPDAPKYLDREEHVLIKDFANSAEISRLNMAAQEQYEKNLRLKAENLRQEVRITEYEIAKAELKKKRFHDDYKNKVQKHDLLLGKFIEKYKVEEKISKVSIHPESGEIITN